MSQHNRASDATLAEWEWERLLQQQDASEQEQLIRDADGRMTVLVYAFFTAWGLVLGITGTLAAQAVARWLFAY